MDPAPRRKKKGKKHSGGGDITPAAARVTKRLSGTPAGYTPNDYSFGTPPSRLSQSTGARERRQQREAAKQLAMTTSTVTRERLGSMDERVSDLEILYRRIAGKPTSVEQLEKRISSLEGAGPSNKESGWKEEANALSTNIKALVVEGKLSRRELEMSFRSGLLGLTAAVEKRLEQLEKREIPPVVEKKEDIQPEKEEAPPVVIDDGRISAVEARLEALEGAMLKKQKVLENNIMEVKKLGESTHDGITVALALLEKVVVAKEASEEEGGDEDVEKEAVEALKSVSDQMKALKDSQEVIQQRLEEFGQVVGEMEGEEEEEMKLSPVKE